MERRGGCDNDAAAYRCGRAQYLPGIGNGYTMDEYNEPANSQPEQGALFYQDRYKWQQVYGEDGI